MLLMERMHGLTQTWVVKAVLTMLPISFLISGMYGYFGSSSTQYAVKVNGEEISQQQFQNRYGEETQRLSQQLGVTKFAVLIDSPEFTKSVKTKVLNGLIDESLLRQYVNDLNLTVSDESVKRAIIEMPAFQVNGKFSNEAYQAILKNNGMSADTYAEYLRQSLRLAQLQQGVLDSDFLTPHEQDTLMKGLFQTRTVRLATFPLAAEVKKQTVTEQEIQDYYNAHKDAFKMPEMVKVQYIDLNQAAIKNNVNVTDVEVQQYYQDHKADFTTKAQQRLAHIQFATEKEAQDAYNALQNGADFAQLAKDKSVDKVSAVNGGELGWLNQGDLPKSFEEVVAKLNVGAYSTPVNVDGQYHIIKLEERKPEVQLSVAQVHDQIASTIRQTALANKFYDVEKQVSEKALSDQDSLDSAAAIAGVKVQETAYFSRENIPEGLNFPAVATAIFDGEISQGNMNSESMNVGDQHSLIVRVLDHKMEGVKSLDEAKPEITTLLASQKAAKILTDNANKWVVDLQKGVIPSEVKFSEEQNWMYMENKDPVLNPVIFAMTAPENGKVNYTVATNKSGDIVIVELNSVKAGNPNAELQGSLNAQILQAQTQEIQDNLVQSLRAKAKIDFNEDFMKQQNEE